MSKSAPRLTFDILPPNKNSHDECSMEVQSAFRSVLEKGKQGVYHPPSCNPIPWGSCQPLHYKALGFSLGLLKLPEIAHPTSRSGSLFSVCFMPELSGVSDIVTFNGN